MSIQEEKCQQLQELHLGPQPFVIPNPWDCGSGALLQGLGFKALATTKVLILSAPVYSFQIDDELPLI